ncbi:MAG: hypothetical protein LBC40_09385, partial [Dysgonamonadaceae bacterium]|nr:hypothetical protein [Dysgonamonadaceae bacterium]
MELIKKTLPASEAEGWYLMQNENRFWTEDFVNEETNEVVSIERNEILCQKGTQINPIIASLLTENGINAVKVSNVPLLGSQEKFLNLWEVTVKTRSAEGDKRKGYLVTADSPAAAEQFISEWME